MPMKIFATGVSNGDVDWLFRGKSKKLGKKMANNNANKDERKNSHGNIKTRKKLPQNPMKLNMSLMVRS